MERPKVSAQMINDLAAMAGFHLTAGRGELLAPQLDWMLKEAQKVEECSRTGLEPAGFFVPALWRPRIGGDGS